MDTIKEDYLKGKRLVAKFLENTIGINTDRKPVEFHVDSTGHSGDMIRYAAVITSDDSSIERQVTVEFRSDGERLEINTTPGETDKNEETWEWLPTVDVPISHFWLQFLDWPFKREK